MDENTIIGCCKSGYQKNKFKKLKKGDLNIQQLYTLTLMILLLSESILEILKPFTT